VYVTKAQRLVLFIYACAGLPLLYTASYNHWNGTVWEWTTWLDVIAAAALLWLAKKVQSPLLVVSLAMILVGFIGRAWSYAIYDNWDALSWISATIAISALWSVPTLRNYRPYIGVFAAVVFGYGLDIADHFGAVSTLVVMSAVIAAITLMVVDPQQILNQLATKLMMSGLIAALLAFFLFARPFGVSDDELFVALAAMTLAKMLFFLVIWLYAREVRAADRDQPSEVLCHQCHKFTTDASLICGKCGAVRVTEPADRSAHYSPTNIHDLSRN
jgi:hypothetical protein